MRRNEALESVTAEFKANGIKFDTEKTGGNHIAIRWQVPDKEVREYVVPSTPGDWRGRLNARAHVRRLLKQDGVQLDRRAAHGPRKPVDLLARALELPHHVEPLPDQIAHLRAEIADLTELVLDLSVAFASHFTPRPPPEPVPAPPPPAPKAKPPSSRSKKALDYITHKWSSLDALARDMGLSTKQVYAKLYYLRDKVEMHEGKARLKPTKHK